MAEAKKKSTFEILNAINVNDKVEKKNGLTYLSWAWAWGEVKKIAPDATYTIYENADGLFYHTDGKTAWVKTGVTVNGIEHIEYLPVMDYKNKSIPVENITSFDVNKTVQRSLTKACARHGLGLYIYAGEDLPEDENPKKKMTEDENPKKKMTDDEKIADIKKKLQETNSDVVKFLLMMSTKHGRSIESVDDMQGKELDYAMDAMQAKIDSIKKKEKK